MRHRPLKGIPDPPKEALEIFAVRQGFFPVSLGLQLAALALDHLGS